MLENKYSRGVVAVATGSKKYPGAALLSVGGARRGNAGYVKFLAKNRALRRLVVSQFPDVVPISSLKNARLDALVVGSGSSRMPRVKGLIPLVIDGEAIRSLLRENFLRRGGLTVITPHEGELRFLNKEIPSNGAERKALALEIAKEFGVIIVLKGHHTVIASPSGKVHIDKIGGPELATAGSGDILAGLIGSMLAGLQDNSEAFELVKSAVELHSLAGKLAAKKYRSVTALEILDSLALVP